MDYRKIIGSMHKLDLLRKIYVRTQCKDVQMHRGQVPILSYISDHENCTQTEAADDMGVSSASVALSAKRMCAAGLIERRNDPNDLRRNLLTITKKGKRALEDFMAVFRELDARTFEGISEEEQERFYDIIRRMMNNVADGGADSSMAELMHKLGEMGGKGEC